MADSDSSSSQSDNNHSNVVTNDTSNLDPSQIPSSPYYLHPSENPGAVLVSPPLTGENFHSWSRPMKRSALLSENEDKFVDGTIIAPAPSNSLFEA